MDCANGKLICIVLKLYFITFFFLLDFIITLHILQCDIGLSDLTLTTNAPDAGDEDVFMVRKFMVSFINFFY